MPKDRIEAAIKRASSKDEKAYEEVIYEGYGPHGVAILIETATDNINRTVANIRSYFSKHNGSLGTSGMLNFIFERKGVSRVHPEGLDVEELELDLIDHGAEAVIEEENELVVYTISEDFGKMKKPLEEKQTNVIGFKP